MTAAASMDASGDVVPRVATLVDWVWIMHDRVNRKLGVKNMLTRRRFRKRLRVTAALVHPSAVWDMVTIIALNYPTDGLDRTVATCDPEQRAKRAGHVVFLDALARLLPLVPDLGSLAPYVDPRSALRTGASLRVTPLSRGCAWQARLVAGRGRRRRALRAHARRRARLHGQRRLVGGLSSSRATRPPSIWRQI